MKSSCSYLPEGPAVALSGLVWRSLQGFDFPSSGLSQSVQGTLEVPGGHGCLLLLAATLLLSLDSLWCRRPAGVFLGGLFLGFFLKVLINFYSQASSWSLLAEP